VLENIHRVSEVYGLVIVRIRCVLTQNGRSAHKEMLQNVDPIRQVHGAVLIGVPTKEACLRKQPQRLLSPKDQDQVSFSYRAIFSSVLVTEEHVVETVSVHVTRRA
jgi:hypothetical protein